MAFKLTGEGELAAPVDNSEQSGQGGGGPASRAVPAEDSARRSTLRILFRNIAGGFLEELPPFLSWAEL